MCEMSIYRYFDSLDAPRVWFSATIDKIMECYGRDHHLLKEDVIFGTCSSLKEGDCAQAQQSLVLLTYPITRSLSVMTLRGASLLSTSSLNQVGALATRGEYSRLRASWPMVVGRRTMMTKLARLFRRGKSATCMTITRSGTRSFWRAFASRQIRHNPRLFKIIDSCYTTVFFSI